MSTVHGALGHRAISERLRMRRQARAKERAAFDTSDADVFRDRLGRGGALAVVVRLRCFGGHAQDSTSSQGFFVFVKFLHIPFVRGTSLECGAFNA